MKRITIHEYNEKIKNSGRAVFGSGSLSLVDALENGAIVTFIIHAKTQIVYQIDVHLAYQILALSATETKENAVAQLYELFMLCGESDKQQTEDTARDASGDTAE